MVYVDYTANQLMGCFSALKTKSRPSGRLSAALRQPIQYQGGMPQRFVGYYYHSSRHHLLFGGIAKKGEDLPRQT
jgi:hypothetical protein